jgi:hypothetical protein
MHCNNYTIHRNLPNTYFESTKCFDILSRIARNQYIIFRLDGQKTERFEVRLLRMSLLAQLIGHHELVVLPFYNYIQRYLTPQQREVSGFWGLRCSNIFLWRLVEL